MVQMSWTFVNDSLCTTLCLQWEPEIIAIAVMFWRPVAIDVINLLKMTKMYYSLEISCAKTLRTGWSELGGAHMGGGWMAGSPPPTLIIGPSLPLYGSGSKKR